MEPVRIRIKSSATEGGQQPQVTEQRYKGKLTEKAGKHYAIYDEDAQSGLEGTKTTLKWDAERVIILRNGSVDHRQEFCKGLMDNSVYSTPYLKIPLTTETKYVYTSFRDGVWRLELEYTLHHGGSPYGDMKLLIEIEEDTELGH